MFSRKHTKLIAIGAAVVVLGGGVYGGVSATAGNGSAPPTASSHSSLPFASHGGRSPGGGGSNARSGPAPGGATGTVEGVSSSGFTMSTSAGQTLTVDETSSGTVKEGERVLVTGTIDGTTITGAEVAVKPAGEPSSTAAEVVPFQSGSPSASKQVGQIPADYSEGSGTIVGGTEANKATEAALVAYPGGIVDRVVKLSNGEYEVHNIGVNWPHHIFVNQEFKVVGAE
jgi:hypothetical protein